MKKILFRADANAQIGLGHVMRCLALAEMLGEAFDRQFALVQPAPEVVRLIEEKSISVMRLQSDDVTDFLSLLDADTVVVLDGYAFDQRYQQTVRQRARALVYIDDLTDSGPIADVIINHAGDVHPSDYQNRETYTEFCLGPQYAILRPDFLRPSGFGLTPEAGPIFVCLGGADSQNISLMVLEAISRVSPHFLVQLVLGPFHPNRPAIEAWKQAHMPDLILLQNLSAGQMAETISRSCLAITACSTISYEVCSVNRPLIGLCTADNQTLIATFLDWDNLAFYVEYETEDMSFHTGQPINRERIIFKLYRALNSFFGSNRSNLPSLANQRRYFDGRSPERFRALFDRLCY